MKPWYQSKTIKVNGGVMLTSVIAILSLPELMSAVALLPDPWPARLAVGIPLVLAVGNIVLRLVTTQPIGTPQPEATGTDMSNVAEIVVRSVDPIDPDELPVLEEPG